MGRLKRILTRHEFAISMDLGGIIFVRCLSRGARCTGHGRPGGLGLWWFRDTEGRSTDEAGCGEASWTCVALDEGLVTNMATSRFLELATFRQA